MSNYIEYRRFSLQCKYEKLRLTPFNENEIKLKNILTYLNASKAIDCDKYLGEEVWWFFMDTVYKGTLNKRVSPHIIYNKEAKIVFFDQYKVWDKLQEGLNFSFAETTQFLYDWFTEFTNFKFMPEKVSIHFKAHDRVCFEPIINKNRKHIDENSYKKYEGYDYK